MKKVYHLKSITTKALTIIVLPLFISFIIANIVSFFSIYKNTLEATGIEAYGCANITTALIDPDLMNKALQGDQKTIKDIGQSLNWTVDHKHIFRNQYILDLEGNVIVTDDYSSHHGLNVGDKHPIDQETIEYIKTHKSPIYSKVYKINGHKTLTGYAPVFVNNDPHEALIGISAIDFDGNIVFERTLENLKSNLLLNTIQILLVMLVSGWFISHMIKPIKTVQKKMKELSDGDLTAEIKIRAKDEIGELAKDVNSLIARFKDILADVSGNTIQVAITSEHLYSNAQNLSVLSDKNAKEMEEVNHSSKMQLEHINETNQILQSTAENIQRISEQLNDFVETLKRTVEDSELGVQKMDETDLQMDEIGTKIQTLNHLLSNLKRKSQQIDEIILFIKQISKRTNILALNATIEASRAGEYGQGFSVVANQIRDLSEQTDTSTKNIQDLVKEIQENILDALHESQSGNEATKLGMSKIKETKEIFKNIANQVKDANIHISTSSSAVETASSELEDIATKMSEMVQILNSIFEFTSNISGSINEQNNAFTEIVNETNTLADLADKLKEKISYFKFE